MSLFSRKMFIALVLHSAFFVSAVGQPFHRAPTDEQSLQAIMDSLREYYRPFLQSLPQPLNIRTRQPISGQWYKRYELEQALAPPENRPEWEKDFQKSLWKETSVPEWQYRSPFQDSSSVEASREPGSRILWYRTNFQARERSDGKRVFLVFEGVDWKAEVFLNGHYLGSHTEYFQPFQFEVTDLLKRSNQLAVRISDGPVFGEQAAYWAPFPVVVAEDQRYVKDRSRSLKGIQKGDRHLGNGYGIHGPVYLEYTGEAVISGLKTRAEPANLKAEVSFHLNTQKIAAYRCEIAWLPENFKGQAYQKQFNLETNRENHYQLELSLPGARPWSPDSPFLYRCRVKLYDGSELIDAQEVVTGIRSFEMVSEKSPRPGLKPGAFLLNGRPVFLRGANLQGMNALSLWEEKDKMLDILLLLKAAHFNFIRSCQHVQNREARALQDRLGLLSMQEKGSRFPDFGAHTEPFLIDAAAKLAEETYHNPGVVMIGLGNERPEAVHVAEWVKAVLSVDDQRIINPVSGIQHGCGYLMKPGALYRLKPELYSRVIEDVHEYPGWYCDIHEPWKWQKHIATSRLVLKGEYGSEALDSYPTMSEHYPKAWGPAPAPGTDTLLGQVQWKKDDLRMRIGFDGRQPRNLGEYILASQRFQAYQLDEVTKGYRLSPQHVAGYMQFHFIDILPANWPKSIVSHDLRPKEGYYAMAQVNQPLAPLPVFSNLKDEMEIWIANDLLLEGMNYTVHWKISADNRKLGEGKFTAEIQALDARLAGIVPLSQAVPEETAAINVYLALHGPEGELISTYERPVFIKAWRKGREAFQK
ncbi:MAG: beta galactosidase jelly roll domain-containing protein [Lewinellaceae bacterium]|nr:beta galactosidase jelly roll domain-containing protein [Lewinellaceae bacterium]